MSPTRILMYSVVMVSCVTMLAAAASVGSMPSQTAAKSQGDAVLFFVTHQGQLREVLFDPIIFNRVLVNQGSAYSNDTGVFIAPVAGIYQFVFAAQLCRGNFNNFWFFMVGGERRMMCHAQVSGGDTTLNSCLFMEELKKGDRVWMQQLPKSCAWASATSQTISFSGVLLASEGISKVGGKYPSCPLHSINRKMASSSAGLAAALSSVTLALLHHFL